MITAHEVLIKAASFLGVHEAPANSNNVLFNTDYYGREVSGEDYPWCCAFVWDIFRILNASDLFCGGEKTAWCPYVKYYAKAHNQWFTKDFKPGDCILFNFQGGTLAGHIGFVETVNADGTITCIEGNTSVTSDDNGGEVMRRIRYLKNILGVFRPAYAIETPWYTQSQTWVKEHGISDGTRPTDPATRAEVWQMFYNFNHG